METEQKYYTANAAVSYCLSSNDLSDHWYNKFLGWGLWGLREFKLKKFQDVKTCLLTVTDRKTVILPKSFVDWTKIGVKVGQYCVTLGINDDLTVQKRHVSDSTVSGLLSQNLPNGTDFSAYSGYYFFNCGGSNVYGYGGGLPSKGYFKVVQRDGCQELILDYDYNYQQVYVEFISDGFDPCKETVLHPYLMDFFVKYMEAEYEQRNNPLRSEASIGRKWRDSEDAKRLANSCFNQIDRKTFLNMSRQEARMTTKL